MLNAILPAHELEMVKHSFEKSVVPEIRSHPGYEGCYFMVSESGVSMIITLWEDQASSKGFRLSERIPNHPQGDSGSSTPVDNDVNYQVTFADHPDRLA